MIVLFIWDFGRYSISNFNSSFGFQLAAARSEQATMRKEEATIFGLCLVDFHHTRGPEVEFWCGLPEGTDNSKIWPNLPFQALPDGSHSFKETFTYFTLLFNEKKRCGPPNGATDLPNDELEDYTTLFAISCSRQIRSEELTHRDKDITRSTVQKAIVVISKQPIFGQIKDKLSLVTNAFFLQRNFSDRSIIKSLYENLVAMFDTLPSSPLESHFYVGLSLRRIIYDFKKDTLVLLKAFLLERQIVFYGSNVERLCNLQFGLISLIPNLLSNLQNSGSPQLYQSLEGLKAADSFKSSDRLSVLRFLGYPLKIFEKGGLFSPYTPLQQMDDIRSPNTDFFVIGTSNSLLIEQKSEICHVFVNVDESSVEIIDKSLQQALQLSSHDKKWTEYISSSVSETWNENDLFTPKNSQFEGSEDFLRWQFEDYLTGLLSSAKLSDYTLNHKDNPIALQTLPEGVMNMNPIHFFNLSWVSKWKETQNYKFFDMSTDDRIFDIFPPKHAYNGIDTLTVIQQKLASTFQNLRSSNSNNSIDKPKEKIESPLQNTEQKDSTIKATTVTDSSITSNEKDQNLWSSWKDYFNAKKNKKKDDSDTTVKATRHLNSSSSTSEAIGSALLGLGLHLAEEEESSQEEDLNVEDRTNDEGRTNDEHTQINDGSLQPNNEKSNANDEEFHANDEEAEVKEEDTEVNDEGPQLYDEDTQVNDEGPQLNDEEFRVIDEDTQVNNEDPQLNDEEFQDNSAGPRASDKDSQDIDVGQMKSQDLIDKEGKSANLRSKLKGSQDDEGWKQINESENNHVHIISGAKNCEEDTPTVFSITNHSTSDHNEGDGNEISS